MSSDDSLGGGSIAIVPASDAIDPASGTPSSAALSTPASRSTTATSGGSFEPIACHPIQLVTTTALVTTPLDADSWDDVTPEGWTPLWSAMGVYHSDLDAIFYRGADMGPDPWSRCFDWHRMEFID